MKILSQSLLNNAPIFLQNFFITIYNSFLYMRRHSGKYSYYRNYYANFENAPIDEIRIEQNRRLSNFLNRVTDTSVWYEKYKQKPLDEFPILEKTDIVQNLHKLLTISERKAIVSYTGGTTGSSLKVLYRKEDVQERQAMLDHFRASSGYKLGKKVAWFGGRLVVRDKDLVQGVCSRFDFINKIRFFSTFHISDENFEVYWESLNAFAPEYIVGYPSSVFDICTMAVERGYTYKSKVSTFFPTAETILPFHREVISRVLGCNIRDQYASSEGAPFILECEKGNLHIHPLTGVFEILNTDTAFAQEGDLLVTSFTTLGTPLIRYKVGDVIKLSEPSKKCTCGSDFPLVDYIKGRASDFIWSQEKGKVGLVNISTSSKEVKGILRFQVIQKVRGEVQVKMVTNAYFNQEEQSKFEIALRKRLGQVIKIYFVTVYDIPREKSGKYRMIKNEIDWSN